MQKKVTEQNINIDQQIFVIKNQLETTFDSLSDIICVIDKNYRVTRINKAGAMHVNFPVKEIPGKKCHSIFWDCDSICHSCPAKKTFDTKEPSKKSVRSKKINDEERFFELETFPVRGNNKKENEVDNVIIHIRDITKEKQMNEELIRSEKLASIGIMTSGLAHEITNPLSGIAGTVENMIRDPKKFGLNEKGFDRLDTIFECANRATLIMKDLLRFSQNEDGIRVGINIKQLIDKVLSKMTKNGIMNYSLFKQEISIDENVPKLVAELPKIEQMMTNLLKNAFRSVLDKSNAMELSGKSYSGKIAVRIRLHEPGKICIEVLDNGVGIPEGMEQKIFDPFFTTRQAGDGTGLGLSICHRIVEQHQGQIEASTRNGLTNITIIVPVGKDPWTEREKSIRMQKGDN